MKPYYNMQTQMKTRVVINATMLLVLIAGCGKQSTSPTQSNIDALAATIRSNANAFAASTAKARADLIASQPKPKTEVEQFADRLVAQHLTQCGESWIGIHHYPSSSCDFKNFYAIIEVRGVNIVVNPNYATDADKLNGIEWHSQIYVRATALRTYYPDNCEQVHKGWTQWQSMLDMSMYSDVLMSWEAEMKAGNWYTSENFYIMGLQGKQQGMNWSIALDPIPCDQKPQ